GPNGRAPFATSDAGPGDTEPKNSPPVLVISLIEKVSETEPAAIAGAAKPNIRATTRKRRFSIRRSRDCRRAAFTKRSPYRTSLAMNFSLMGAYRGNDAANQ